MTLRAEDHPTAPGDLGLPKVYVNRVLPLWSILTAIAVVIGFGIRISYQVDDIAKEQAKTSVDVKAIKEEQENAGRKQFEAGFQVGDMNRRLTVIEDKMKKSP